MLPGAPTGHLIPPVVEIESPTELSARRPLLLLLVMDIEWLHRHRPSGKEVETRIFSCNEVTMMALDIIAPLNLATSLLDNFYCVAIWDPWER